MIKYYCLYFFLVFFPIFSFSAFFLYFNILLIYFPNFIYIFHIFFYIFYLFFNYFCYFLWFLILYNQIKFINNSYLFIINLLFFYLTFIFFTAQIDKSQNQVCFCSINICIFLLIPVSIFSQKHAQKSYVFCFIIFYLIIEHFSSISIPFFILLFLFFFD